MPLLLRRAQGNRPGGDWDKDDFDVMDDERVVGRIFLDANGRWFWGLGFFAQLDGVKRYGTVESRDEAMAAFRAEYGRWQAEAR